MMGQYPVVKIEGDLGIWGESQLEENEEQNPTGREVNRGASAGPIINCYNDLTEALKSAERTLIRGHKKDSEQTEEFNKIMADINNIVSDIRGIIKQNISPKKEARRQLKKPVVGRREH